MGRFIQENKNVIVVFIALAILFMVRITPISDQDKEGTYIENAKGSDILISDIPFHKIFIDISGAVVNPGVYEVTDNILVNDAINLAGGLNDRADRDHVDQFIPLAKKVYSEMKIYIPFVNEIVVLDDPKFYINTASKDQLIDIKGIGEVTAQKIIDNRPFYSWDELLEVTDIRGDALIELKSKAWL